MLVPSFIVLVDSKITEKLDRNEDALIDRLNE
jgi:hypothetical protein